MNRLFRVGIYIACIACLLQVVAFGALLVWLEADDELSYTQLLAQAVERLAPKTFRFRDDQETWLAREVTNPKWKPSRNGVWGYASRQSVAPGQDFELMLSIAPWGKAVEGRVEIWRVGHHAGEERRLAKRTDILTVKAQSVPASASSTGAGWEATVSIDDTQAWTSGYYAVDFIEQQGTRHRDVAFVVVTNPERSGDVLVKLSTNTYNAYNRWGGHSLYRARFGKDPGRIVSFDRPSPPDFYRWEYYYVVWLEELALSEGFSIDYAADVDVHREKAFTEAYKLVISVGHDEYWSKEEFDNFYDRIFVRGGNVLFLGANIAYWQVRYADVDSIDGAKGRQRQMVCHKDATDPIVNTLAGESELYLANRFRDASRRPETMLMGVGFAGYYRPDPAEDVGYDIGYDYRVTDAGFHLFSGTGFETGDVLEKLVGYEWDNTDPAGDGARLWSAEKSRIPELERDRLKVLFNGTAVDTRGAELPAEAVYFESDAGAKVFSAGTVQWSWGLNKPGFENEKFARFNKNLIRDFLQ